MKNHYIGIMMDDGPGLSIGLLGILKSGNCFVPINPVYPTHRIQFIIDDCHIKILLTDKSNYEKAQQIVKDSPIVQHLICIDDIVDGKNYGIINKATCGDCVAEISKEPYCYVIYTSGSTGKPKGVPITHRNLIPLFYYSMWYLGLGVDTRVMQNLSYAFDFGIFEILTTLIFGGRFFILNKSIISDFSYYSHFIDCRQINTLHTTPVFLNNLADSTNSADSSQKMYSLKLIHLGGEQLTGEVTKKAMRMTSHECHFYNGYGPTEASINCTFFFIKEEKIETNVYKNIPIGHPCDLHKIYILDRHFNLQPIGIMGELSIAGPGLSDGYLNQPE